MSHKKLILIADDEVAIHDSLRLYLQREGYEVYSVFRGTDVMEAFQRMRPDLVILDIMMPGRSGTEVCADIRAISMTPVIILTAKGEEADRLLGFALGADDYIVKPFSPREIVSRIRVIFRRINSLETAQEKNELQIGNTRINLSRYEVCVDGEKVVFSPKEVEILHLMAAHLNQVFTREQLLDHIWGYEYIGDTRTVDVHIKRLREKIKDHKYWSINTVWGIGYKFEVKA